MNDSSKATTGSRAHPLRTVISLVVFAAVVYFFVLPLFRNFDQTWEKLRQLDPALGLVAVVLEISVWWLYGQTYRLLLPKQDRPSPGICFATSVAAKGVSHVLPGGGAGTVAVDYALMRKAGVPDGPLVYAFGAAGALSGVVLNVLLALSLIIAIPTSGQQDSYLVGIAIGIITIGSLALLVWGLLRRTDKVARLAAGAVDWIPRVHASTVESWVHDVARNLRRLEADRERRNQVLVISVAKWVVGAAAAWMVFVALGHRTSFFAVFVAFALAKVVSAIPVSPGGLGIFEATMIATLVAFGLPHVIATAGVLAFRLINFWLPIPLGAACFAWVGYATDRGQGVAPAARQST